MGTIIFDVKGRIGCVEEVAAGEYVQRVYSSVIITV
jgi:hypothetical protein